MINNDSGLIRAGNHLSFHQLAGETVGHLGEFDVSTSSESPSDIAKASSMAYHLDVDGDGPFFKNVRTTKRRKRIKSKFSKRLDDDDVDVDDVSDVDEASKEEKGDNDTKMSRMLNVHIAKKAELHARMSTMI